MTVVPPGIDEKVVSYQTRIPEPGGLDGHGARRVHRQHPERALVLRAQEPVARPVLGSRDLRRHPQRHELDGGLPLDDAAGVQRERRLGHERDVDRDVDPERALAAGRIPDELASLGPGELVLLPDLDRGVVATELVLEPGARVLGIELVGDRGRKPLDGAAERHVAARDGDQAGA